LQVALSIGHAYSAYVVAFGKKQFGRYALVPAYAFGSGTNNHVGRHFGGAGAQQPVGAFYFYQAQAAGAGIAQSIQVAHSKDFDAMGAAHFQNGFALGRVYLAVVNYYRNGSHNVRFFLMILYPLAFGGYFVVVFVPEVAQGA
jgi:hypothetical protein